METPLLDVHKKLGANLGRFADILTALDFGNPMNEHVATRTYVAVFDVSHMARIIVEGADSPRLLDNLIPRSISKSKDGHMLGPTAFLNEKAGFKDDVMLYRISHKQWLIVCNAVNRSKILHWLEHQADALGIKDISIVDVTFETAMIAIQGPQAAYALKSLGLELETLNKLQFATNVRYRDSVIDIVSRSGWTGEDGFEAIGKPDVIAKLFMDLVNQGKAKPAGLIARDMLRIEMGFCLYGREISEDISPIEARYWVFDLDKKSYYIGRDALLQKLRNGVDMIRLGIRMKKGIRFIPRYGDKVYIPESDIEIGYVTSGTFSPILQRSIAMAYIHTRYAIPGLEIEVSIRGQRYRGKLMDFPFVKPKT
ncbi:MAG TPA: glycine cleavage system aminomethyltransferase GcvT [Ignisphaera aggregans]|uniref:aminomethyltransferase n=1 Tax=Ignisphaera aggregans TaxID=334771 RepID=A0A832YYW6_9CREN|nr:glycine cleavage system aminomethyltransferase GcvT [Ignisphaera aggregans]